jgi:hypothetical protein
MTITMRSSLVFRKPPAQRSNKVKRQTLFLAPVLLTALLLPYPMLGQYHPTRSVLVGKWAGRVSSRNYASFELTIDISPDSKAHVVGDGSPCFTEADLMVTSSGSNAVTIVGRSKAGENLTFKGTIDSSGKQLDLTYIVNGSGSARCETDQGAGTVDKQ